MPEGFGCIGRLDKDTTGLLLFTNDGDLGHVVTKKGNRISKIYELTIAEPDLTLEDMRIRQLLDGVDLYKGEEPAKATSITICPPSLTSSTLISEREKAGLEESHKRKEPSGQGEEEDNREAKRKRKEKEENEMKEERKGKGAGEDVPKLNKRQRKQMKQLMRGTTNLSLEIREGRNRVIRRMCSHVRLPLVHLHRVRIGNIDLSDLGLEGRLGEWRYVNEDKVEELWQMVGGRDEAVTRQQVMALAGRIRRAHEESKGANATECNKNEPRPDQEEERDTGIGKDEGLDRLKNWFARHNLMSFALEELPELVRENESAV